LALGIIVIINSLVSLASSSSAPVVNTLKARRMVLQHASRLFRTYFCVAADNKDLLRAQFEAYQKQMPLLYIILSVNTAALAYSFRLNAPASLVLIAPGLMCLICIVRLLIWIFRRRIRATDEQVLQKLRTTNNLSVLISIVFCSWSLSLYQYGDAYMRGHVAFYMALTEIAVIFCLMHLRSAALITAILVIVPFCIFFFMTGIPSFTAIAVNLALVCCAMMSILFIYYRDFANLVESRKSLIDKQKETQRLSDENFRIANLDSLTDLPNRRSFFADIEACEAEARQCGATFAIGIIDLDGFKPVNDTFGHKAGDAVLAAVGVRLREVCRKSDLVARIGGDEFIVLLRDVTASACDGLAESMIRRISERYPLDSGRTVAIGVSIGWACFPDDSDDLDELQRKADAALYDAKTNGKGVHRRYADLDAPAALAVNPYVIPPPSLPGDVCDGRPSPASVSTS